MANTKKLTKEERKKSKRAAARRSKRKAEEARDYARGSKKRKVKSWHASGETVGRSPAP